MDRKRGAVHGPVALHDVAVVVDQDQIRDADLREVHAERVDPEVVQPLGVAGGDVPRTALVEAAAREEPERGREPLLAVQPLVAGGCERWPSERFDVRHARQGNPAGQAGVLAPLRPHASHGSLAAPSWLRCVRTLHMAPSLRRPGSAASARFQPSKYVISSTGRRRAGLKSSPLVYATGMSAACVTVSGMPSSRLASCSYARCRVVNTEPSPRLRSASWKFHTAGRIDP